MQSNRINNVVDPASVQDAATKNYVDTAVAGVGGASSGSGGNSDSDQAVYGDFVSTMPRWAVQSSVNFQAMSASTQYAYSMKTTASFSSTGVRYATASTSILSGTTVTVSLWSGASQSSMSALGSAVAAPFSTQSALVSVNWPLHNIVTAGWVTVLFTCTVTTGNGPRLVATPAFFAGAFLNPTGVSVASTRASTSLTSPINLTTGWAAQTVLPYVALF